MSINQWFSVDKEGLAKLREDTPKVALVHELVQNSWDTDAKNVAVLIDRTDERGVYMISVQDDDPNGFKDLTHAYTLFAESDKKSDPSKRGRFNFGEKLVLSLCREAWVKTTSGTVLFNRDGTRTQSREKTETGSIFCGYIRMNQTDCENMIAEARNMLPSAGCFTKINGEYLNAPPMVKSIDATLPTTISDGDGVMRPTRRKTVVEIHRTHYNGQEAMIYEGGIPVVAWDGKYHVNVLQKLPLTIDRTNVTPAFLREMQHVVCEAVIDLLEKEDANKTWVREAMAHPEASLDVVKTVMEHRFGKGAVVYDPSDVEANKRAVDAGKQLIYGSQMNSQEWANVRSHGVASPAGKVFTSHKIEFDPDGREMNYVTDLTDPLKKVVAFVKALGKYALGVDFNVAFVIEPIHVKFAAFHTPRRVTFNLGKLGKKTFDHGITLSHLDLIIHELAHEVAADHLSPGFYNACTKIGASAAWLALDDPETFGFTQDRYPANVTLAAVKADCQREPDLEQLGFKTEGVTTGRMSGGEIANTPRTLNEQVKA